MKTLGVVLAIVACALAPCESLADPSSPAVGQRGRARGGGGGGGGGGRRAAAPGGARAPPPPERPPPPHPPPPRRDRPVAGLYYDGGVRFRQPPPLPRP